MAVTGFGVYASMRRSITARRNGARTGGIEVIQPDHPFLIRNDDVEEAVGGEQEVDPSGAERLDVLRHDGQFERVFLE